jgi:GNAT superfamily N-acetyltransferase
MAQAGLDDAVRIAPIRSKDVRAVHSAYDLLGEDGKRYFHPGFLGSDPLSVRGLAGRFLLRASAASFGGRALRALRIPFLISWVARRGTTTCGFAFVLARPYRRTGSFGVFVLPPFEGQGIGGRLTESVLREAARAGLREIQLTVRVDNDRARQLYERRGFSIVETVRQGDVYGGDAYDSHRMILRLVGPETAHGERTSS